MLLRQAERPGGGAEIRRSPAAARDLFTNDLTWINTTTRRGIYRDRAACLAAIVCVRNYHAIVLCGITWSDHGLNGLRRCSCIPKVSVGTISSSRSCLNIIEGHLIEPSSTCEILGNLNGIHPADSLVCVDHSITPISILIGIQATRPVQVLTNSPRKSHPKDDRCP